MSTDKRHPPSVSGDSNKTSERGTGNGPGDGGAAAPNSTADMPKAGSVPLADRNSGESASIFPVRTCEGCGWKTTSTSTIDWCIKCHTDGLRPKHFLTAQRTSEPIAPVTCAFCSRPASEPGVKWLIIPKEGAQSGICSTCVDIAREAIAERDAKSGVAVDKAVAAPPDNLCTWCRKPMAGHPMMSCVGEIEPGSVADDVLKLAHAFSDVERKDGVRALAHRVRRLEESANRSDYPIVASYNAPPGSAGRERIMILEWLRAPGEDPPLEVCRDIADSIEHEAHVTWAKLKGRLPTSGTRSDSPIAAEPGDDDEPEDPTNLPRNPRRKP